MYQIIMIEDKPHPILQDLIKGTNDPSEIPPIRRLNRLGANTTARPTSTLDLSDGSEPASGESLFEFRGDRMIRVEICVKCRQEDSTVSVSSAFGGDVSGWWRETVDVVDVSTSIGLVNDG